jgi:cell division protein FtsN
MKVLSIILILIVLMNVSCKTQKIAPKPEPVKSESVKSESYKPESVKSETVAKSYGSGSSSSIKGKEERITAAKGEASDLGSKRFYIILGVFSVYENAQRFKKQLAAEDFSPGILVNEKEQYRVCVNSYNDEDAARAKLGEIRQNSKYSEAWLLIKK